MLSGKAAISTLNAFVSSTTMTTLAANSSTPQHNQTSLYNIGSIVGQTCFSLLIILAALVGNCLVVASVWTSKKLRKSTNYFIVSLAISDILIAATIMPFRVHHLMNLMIWDLGPNVCKFWFVMDFLCTSASTMNVALIAVDRFLALSYPFKYPHLVSGLRCAIAIAVVWSFSVLLASLSLIEWSDDASLHDTPACLKRDKNYYLFATFLGLFTPLVILIVAYSLVFRVALRQAVRIRAYSNVQNNLEVTAATENGHRKSTPNGKRAVKTRLLLRELKATKTLMIVVGTFLVCWFPLCVVLMVIQHCPTCLNRTLSPTWQQIIGITFVYTLPRLNSALNPIIYSIFNREFRAVLCLLCGKITGVLPRPACVAGPTVHGDERGPCCGFLRAGNVDSSTDSGVIYDAKSAVYTTVSFGRASREPSVFAFKKLDSCFYESSV